MKAIICLVLLAGTVLAQPAPAPAAKHTVIVLPIDGDADEALRNALTAAIEKSAKTDPTAEVKQGGTTTFGDMATAVGCDPATPACAETVRGTLRVDEVVYGTATKTADGKIKVVVRKKLKDKDPEEVTTTLQPADPADKIEPVVQPLVGGPVTPPVTCPDSATPGPDGKCPVEKPKKKPVNQARVLSTAGMIAGGVLVLAGFGSWSSASGLQGDIDDSPTPMTSNDFDRLKDLEDRASSRAWTGNVLVVGGLALAGYSYYRFRKAKRADTTTVTPTPVPGGGAAVVIRFAR